MQQRPVEEAGTCSRSAAWRRCVRVQPLLRVGRPSPGRFPDSAPLALRIGTPDQPSIWTRREGQPQQASNPPVNSLTLVLYLVGSSVPWLGQNDAGTRHSTPDCSQIVHGCVVSFLQDLDLEHDFHIRKPMRVVREPDRVAPYKKGFRHGC